MLSCRAAETHLSWARSGLGPNFAGNLLHCTANYWGEWGGISLSAPRFGERNVMECQAGSFRLDTRELDHLCPFFRFSRDKSAEIPGTENHRYGAELGEP